MDPEQPDGLPYPATYPPARLPYPITCPPDTETSCTTQSNPPQEQCSVTNPPTHAISLRLPSQQLPDESPYQIQHQQVTTQELHRAAITAVTAAATDTPFCVSPRELYREPDLDSSENYSLRNSSPADIAYSSASESNHTSPSSWASIPEPTEPRGWEAAPELLHRLNQPQSAVAAHHHRQLQLGHQQTQMSAYNSTLLPRFNLRNYEPAEELQVPLTHAVSAVPPPSAAPRGFDYSGAGSSAHLDAPQLSYTTPYPLYYPLPSESYTYPESELSPDSKILKIEPQGDHDDDLFMASPPNVSGDGGSSGTMPYSIIYDVGGRLGSVSSYRGFELGANQVKTDAAHIPAGSGTTGERTPFSVPRSSPREVPSNPEVPYAQLIYRAFMSTPRHAMTLQEIYQWFRDNTDKSKGQGKGWQNSIRHNLSMNAAFTKRESHQSSGASPPSTLPLGPSSLPPNLILSSNNGVADARTKSTEWFLEEWAVRNGVQSTTRYRNNSGKRRDRRRRTLVPARFHAIGGHRDTSAAVNEAVNTARRVTHAGIRGSQHQFNAFIAERPSPHVTAHHHQEQRSGNIYSNRSHRDHSLGLGAYFADSEHVVVRAAQHTSSPAGGAGVTVSHTQFPPASPQEVGVKSEDDEPLTPSSGTLELASVRPLPPGPCNVGTIHGSSSVAGASMPAADYAAVAGGYGGLAQLATYSLEDAVSVYDGKLSSVAPLFAENMESEELLGNLGCQWRSGAGVFFGQS